MSVLFPIRRYPVKSIVNFGAEVCKVDEIFPFVLLSQISIFSKSRKYKFLFNNPLVALILLSQPTGLRNLTLARLD